MASPRWQLVRRLSISLLSEFFLALDPTTWTARFGDERTNHEATEGITPKFFHIPLLEGSSISKNIPKTIINCFSSLTIVVAFFLSLHQDITHGSDVFVAVISPIQCHVSTGVGVTNRSVCTKTNSRVAGDAIVFVVTKDTDPHALTDT